MTTPKKIVGGRGKAGFLSSIALAGTSSVIAVNFTHPIEVAKTRMQVGNFDARKLIAEEGVTGFYKGIQAAYLREVSYTSLKLGLYAPIRNVLGVDENTPFYLKFIAGSLSGSIGSVVGNPFDVMKTILMSNPESRASLRSVMKQMLMDQGIAGFYRGVQANIMRACVLNGTKMACYDQIKGYVVKFTGWKRKDLKVMFLSAVGAGFFMTLTVSPFDMVRTTLMNQPTDRKVYKGFLDAVVKIWKNEGPRAFYRGFFPIWGRFAPQAMIMLMVYEKLLNMFGFDPI